MEILEVVMPHMEIKKAADPRFACTCVHFSSEGFSACSFFIITFDKEDLFGSSTIVR